MSRKEGNPTTNNAGIKVVIRDSAKGLPVNPNPPKPPKK